MNAKQRRAEWQQQRRSARRRRCLQKEAAAVSTIYLPDDLIKEVLSFLSVKSLIRLKCVSKPFNFFISDSTFVKMHLNRSSQNKDQTFVYTHGNQGGRSVRSMHLTVVRVLDNPPITIVTRADDPYNQLNDRYAEYRDVIGSCNGLLCLLYRANRETWSRFWNPATKKISDKLGYCDDDLGLSFNFTFGYDNSKDTFKVVRFLPETTNVRVLSLNDNVWRNIQNSPVTLNHRPNKMTFVHFSNSINWLIICNYSVDDDDYDDYDDYYKYKYIGSIKQFVIISLDLRTETHTKLLPPQGFNEVPFVMPKLSVLNDCLCFSHDFKRTHLIIWKMKEFGVENSWTQFLKISYHILQLSSPYSFCSLFPLHLSEKNDTLLLTNNLLKGAFLYNWRENTATFLEKDWGYMEWFMLRVYLDESLCSW